MHILTRIRLHQFIGIVGLVVALLCSGCAGGGSTVTSGNRQSASSSATASTTSQQVSRLLSGPVTYVALGASDAVGVGSASPGSQGYVPLLAAHLPKGSHMINLGISGIHLHEALSKELPLALIASPNLVTIWLVANDFIAGVTYTSYMYDLNTLLERLHSGTHARIVMADLPDLTLLPALAHLTATQKTNARQEILRWNAGIAQMAAHYGVVILDLFSRGSQLTAHPEYISADGFHPSYLGYVQLANAFWGAIKGS